MLAHLPMLAVPVVTLASSSELSDYGRNVPGEKNDMGA